MLPSDPVQSRSGVNAQLQTFFVTSQKENKNPRHFRNIISKAEIKTAGPILYDGWTVSIAEMQ